MSDKHKRYREKKRTLKYGPNAGDMRGRHKNHRRGASHPRWRGGVWQHVDGYLAIRVPLSHPHRMANGYAYVHMIVIEATMGRRLRKGEHVHHRDGNVRNNAPSNLEVIDASEHARIHAIASERTRRGQFKAGEKRVVTEALRVRQFPEVTR